MIKNKIAKTTKKETLPIKWHFPDTTITRFASNIIIETIENELKILFFEIKPELYFNPSQPNPTEIQADCVASVIMPLEKIPKFIEMLKEQLFPSKRSKQNERAIKKKCSIPKIG